MIKMQRLSISDMNRFILLWEISILCIRKTSSTCVDFLSPVNSKGGKIVVSAKFERYG
jgi:hypothetical protein